MCCVIAGLVSLLENNALTKPPIDMLQTGSLRTVEIFVQASIDLPKEGDDNPSRSLRNSD